MAIFVAFIASIVAGCTSFFLHSGANLPVELLRFLMLISNGAILVITSMSHLFKPEFMAQELGWTAGGPFQKVVGFWNLGAGATSIMSFWIGGDFLLAAAICTATFWAGAALLHWSAYLKLRESQRLTTAAGESVLVITLMGLLWMTR